MIIKNYRKNIHKVFILKICILNFFDFRRSSSLKHRKYRAGKMDQWLRLQNLFSGMQTADLALPNISIQHFLDPTSVSIHFIGHIVLIIENSLFPVPHLFICG